MLPMTVKSWEAVVSMIGLLSKGEAIVMQLRFESEAQGSRKGEGGESGKSMKTPSDNTNNK